MAEDVKVCFIYFIIPTARTLAEGEVIENYHRKKGDVRQLVEGELERKLDTPALAGLMIK